MRILAVGEAVAGLALRAWGAAKRRTEKAEERAWGRERAHDSVWAQLRVARWRFVYDLFTLEFGARPGSPGSGSMPRP